VKVRDYSTQPTRQKESAKSLFSRWLQYGEEHGHNRESECVTSFKQFEDLCVEITAYKSDSAAHFSIMPALPFTLIAKINQTFAGQARYCSWNITTGFLYPQCS